MQTRSSKKALFTLPQHTGEDLPAVAKLRQGGRGGRLTTGHAERIDDERCDNAEWFMHPEATQTVHKSQKLVLCLPCNNNCADQIHDERCDNKITLLDVPVVPANETILVDISQLKKILKINLRVRNAWREGGLVYYMTSLRGRM